MEFEEFLQLLENAPIGHRLRDQSGNVWIKDDPMMWDGLNGIRMNAAALYVHCVPTEKKRKGKEPSPKQKVLEMSQPLF